MNNISETISFIKDSYNTKDSIYSGQGRDALVDATADSQNQSRSQTTSEQQAAQTRAEQVAITDAGGPPR